MPSEYTNGVEIGVALSDGIPGAQQRHDGRTNGTRQEAQRTNKPQHDSVLDSNFPARDSSLASPLRSEFQQEIMTTNLWLEDAAAEEAWALGGRTPTTMRVPPRKESLPLRRSATSPLAYSTGLDDDIPIMNISPALRASGNSSPNIRNEFWRQSDISPQPSPRVARTLEARNSDSSALHTPVPVGVTNARLRGMTASSAHHPSLYNSASIPDFRLSNHTLPTNIYRPSRDPAAMARDSAQSSLRRDASAPPLTEESRSSVRSGFTAASSGFIGSERSSVLTRASSTSDLRDMSREMSKRMDDLLLSVEDAISMYAHGFVQIDGVTTDVPAVPDLPIEFSEDEVLRGRDSSRLQEVTVYDDQSRLDQLTPVPPPSQVARAPLISPDHHRVAQSQNQRPQIQTGGRPALGEGRQSSPFEIRFPGAGPETPFELKSPTRDDSPSSADVSDSLPSRSRSEEQLNSNTFNDPPPPFTTSPISPKSPSQPPTPVAKDVFIRQPSKQKTPPRPNVSNISKPIPQTKKPYVPLPSAPDVNRQKTVRSSAAEFVNPREAPLRPAQPVSRDRYGFKKATQYINVEQYDEWNEGYSEYLDRRKGKWMLLMKQYGLQTENPLRFPPKTEKVKRYLRKGVPPEWRGAAWWWYAGGPAKLVQNSGLYWSLMERVNKGELSDSDREHIERDLNRTFPDNIRFKPDAPLKKGSKDKIDIDEKEPPDTAIVRALRRVLQAFAVHNPNIGYCQSLNFLAGLLLLFMNDDEEKAFTMLNIITTNHLPGTHAKVLEANVDIGVLMTLIKETMPSIWGKIDDNADDAKLNNPSGSLSRLPTVSLATTAWFMSCFIGNLPIETVLRVWDVFFYEGSKTLFRIALTIFKIGEEDIRAVAEHMEIFQLVQTIPRRLLDANGLMEACYKRRNGFGHVSQDTIERSRLERRKLLADERARKMGAKSATQANGQIPLEDERESRSRLGAGFGSIKRAASRARIKHAQSKKRTPKASPA